MTAPPNPTPRTTTPRLTRRALVLRYSAFAVLATLANLATQRAVLQHGADAGWFAAAVGAGTLVGLVLKYLLDKRWIFHDVETGLRSHSRKFSRYTAMGGITTAIFWATETAFWLIWGTDLMRELGAVIGLTIGYVLKYQLDRRYVFAPRMPAPEAPRDAPQGAPGNAKQDTPRKPPGEAPC